MNHRRRHPHSTRGGAKRRKRRALRHRLRDAIWFREPMIAIRRELGLGHPR